MIAQHTPGPWGVRPGHGCYDINAGLIYVAETIGGMSGNYGSEEANACLIAAAPDLLAALEMTDLGLHNADERGPCLCSQCAFRQAARAAIVKAKGGA